MNRKSRKIHIFSTCQENNTGKDNGSRYVFNFPTFIVFWTTVECKSNVGRTLRVSNNSWSFYNFKTYQHICFNNIPRNGAITSNACCFLFKCYVCVASSSPQPPLCALNIKQSSPMLTPAAVCTSNYSLCRAGSQGKTGGQVTYSQCTHTLIQTGS